MIHEYDEGQTLYGPEGEPATPEERYQILSDLQAEFVEQLRAKRNELLAETDWWVLPDRTATQAQLDYRQALRDITQTYSNVRDVVWPTKPE